MKKILLFIGLLFITFYSNAQTDTLTGCMGIKFGFTTTQVRTAITSKNAGFNLYTNTPDIVSYTEGKFAGRTCVGAVFAFYENKLYTIKILLDPEYEPKTYDLYLEVREELSQKYGLNYTEAHIYRSPYSEGDGYLTTAVKSGYVDIGSYFIFPDGNVVSIEITKSLSVMLTYQDSKMATKSVEENNNKRSKDY